MKTVCIMDSVSRVNGGLFEAERRLQQTLHGPCGIDVQVVGLQDAHTHSDLAAWAPLRPVTFPVSGPRAFGFAAGFTDALTKTDADLGYLAGLWKFPSVAALRWSNQSGKPLMVAPHGMLDSWALRNSGAKKKLAGWLFQDELLRQAACLRALCPAEAASIRAYGLQNPICVIPNGIDLPVLADASPPRHILFPPGRKVLLSLGRLHPKKGLTHLLTAWSRTWFPGCDWILAVAGWDQGGHEMELKQQATDLGIDWADAASFKLEGATIRFLGPQFDGDKESCYRSCDAFILPSFSEGLPMVILEAWAYTKPVLMTAECNLPEGFAAHAALRVEPTVESLMEGLRQLFALSNEGLLTMGRRGSALVENRFSWPKLAAQMASRLSVDAHRRPCAGLRREGAKRLIVKMKILFWRGVITLIFGIVTLGVAAFLFPQQVLTVDSGDTKADELVVLGGGDGRAERAAELFQQGVARGILVTGYGDCESNVQVLEKNGVPASVITREPKALTTLENTEFSIPLLRKMGAHRVIIVTSWFHSRRALACFEHFAPDIKFYSRPSYVDYQPKKSNREGFNEHVNIEYVKLLDYWISHDVRPL